MKFGYSRIPTIPRREPAQTSSQQSPCPRHFGERRVTNGEGRERREHREVLVLERIRHTLHCDHVSTDLTPSQPLSALCLSLSLSVLATSCSNLTMYLEN